MPLRKLSDSDAQILERLREVRMRIAGPRGKAAFARLLGLSPSTYNYYEKSRVPPAWVLQALHHRAGVDLHWLLTGTQSDVPAEAEHPLARRLGAILQAAPELSPPAAAFLDLLEAHRERQQDREEQPPIPILARSAAGVVHCFSTADRAVALNLGALEHRAEAARLYEEARPFAAPAETGEAHLLHLARPTPEGVSEYVLCPEIARRYPDAFGFRIDGESMLDRYRDGDVVLVSPSRPAEDGRPAVVLLKHQIGPTCKIYRREGDRVHLIPLHSRFSAEVFPAEDVVWALAVLASIRPHR